MCWQVGGVPRSWKEYFKKPNNIRNVRENILEETEEISQEMWVISKE